MSDDMDTDRRLRDDADLRELVSKASKRMKEKGIEQRPLDWDRIGVEQRALWKRNRGLRAATWLSLGRLASKVFRTPIGWKPARLNREEAGHRLQNATFSLALGQSQDQPLEDINWWGTGIFISSEYAVTADHNPRPSKNDVFRARYKGHEIRFAWMKGWSSKPADIAILHLISKPDDVDVEFIPPVYFDPATALNVRSREWAGHQVAIFGYPVNNRGMQGWIIDGFLDARQPVLAGVEYSNRGAGNQIDFEYEHLAIRGSGIEELEGISGAGIMDLELGAIIGVQHRYEPVSGKVYGTAFDFFLGDIQVPSELKSIFKPIPLRKRTQRRALFPVLATAMLLVLLAIFGPVWWIRPKAYQVLNDYVPSLWMGDCAPGRSACSWTIVRDTPRSAPDCVRVTYRPGSADFGGMYLVFPPENIGDRPGRNLKRYRRLTFWARAETEAFVEFKSGGIDNTPKVRYRDSFGKGLGTTYLDQEWRQFTIDLGDEDLSSVIGAFAWVATSASNPHGAVFYLDDIQFEW